MQNRLHHYWRWRVTKSIQQIVVLLARVTTQALLRFISVRVVMLLTREPMKIVM
jgi:hypothetical protein